MGTCTRFTSARNQEPNVSAYRAIAAVVEILICYLNYEQTHRVGIIPHLIFAINNSPSRALHAITPIFCELGFHPKIYSPRWIDQRLTLAINRLRDSIVAARDDVAQRANSKWCKIDKRTQPLVHPPQSTVVPSCDDEVGTVSLSSITHTSGHDDTVNPETG